MAPIPYPSLYTGEEDRKITTSAAMWGVPGEPGEQITMTRYYTAKRTFWVDPVSGTIVKQTEQAHHYYARDALKPEVTLADYKLTSTPDTVESQVNSARDERDRLALWSRVLPITFTAIGLIALIGGAVLASFSLRTESALTDPGLDRDDTDFLRRAGLEPPVPGAEAETEKMPAQRPVAHDEDPSPPGLDPPPDPAAPEAGHLSPARRLRVPQPRPERTELALPERTRALQLVPAGVCVGAGAAGGRATAAARVSAAARRGVHAAVVSVRYARWG